MNDKKQTALNEHYTVFTMLGIWVGKLKGQVRIAIFLQIQPTHTECHPKLYHLEPSLKPHKSLIAKVKLSKQPYKLPQISVTSPIQAAKALLSACELSNRLCTKVNSTHM